MQPSHYDLLGQVPDDARPAAAPSPARVTRDPHHHPMQSRSPSGVAPTRSEDSWIEVSSQPSSSSLSSAATNDDIITTGLRVEQNGSRPYHHRSHRRRLQHLAAVTTAQVDYSSQQSSSQDEYEESESESDRVLSSSNEDMARRPHPTPLLSQTAPSISASDASDDDNSTALGMRISSSPFVPQPNVFSHPPATQHPSWTRPSERHRSQPSEVSNCSRRTAIRRGSQASTQSSHRASRQQQHSPYNMISPSYHADHDAALRASLSTLLSCAAAARGLPKQEQQPPQPGPSQQPAAFRLVSESVAMGEEASGDDVPAAGDANLSNRQQRQKPQTSPVAAYPPAANKVKRRSSTSKDRSSTHSAKKTRRTTTEPSPTMMTWVISAGVVVLFSAISFSAGYVLGREVGRLEANPGIVDGNFSSGRASARCGQEAVKGGLKRFRWGTGTSGSGIIA